MYDVIVIGMGPAGLSAAINVRQRGGSALVAGLPMTDNPLAKAEKIDNYLGLPGKTGSELMEIFKAHADAMGVEYDGQRVLSAFYTGTNWMVSAGSNVYEAYALVFAGGIVRGKTYPGEEEYLGRGVSYCATCDGMLYRGKKVAVIGFGDGDKEEAQFLTDIGCTVHYVQKPKKVVIEGGARVEKAVIDGEEFTVDGVFVLRPSLSPASIFPGLEVDGAYIKTDRNMATNLPGLFAAGDCTGLPLQISKAAGEGLIAGQKAMAHAAAMKKNEGK